MSAGINFGVRNHARLRKDLISMESLRKTSVWNVKSMENICSKYREIPFALMGDQYDEQRRHEVHSP